MLTDIYITVPSQEIFPEISVSSVAKNDRVQNKCLNSNTASNMTAKVAKPITNGRK